MNPIYPKPFMLKALGSNKPTVALWGAYQLLLSDQGASELSLFLNSPYDEIVEAGVAQAGALMDEANLPWLIRIFRQSEGQLKYQSAINLAKFPNDFSRSLLSKWFWQLIQSDQATRFELEAAALAFLKVDPKKHFPQMLDQLKNRVSDPIVGGILFLTLLPEANNKKDFFTLMDQYFILRDVNNDAELTDALRQEVGYMELIDWFSSKLAKGFRLPVIYEQCCRLLGSFEGVAVQRLWDEIKNACRPQNHWVASGPNDPAAMIHALREWLGKLPLQDLRKDQQALWCLEAFAQHAKSFGNTIPKIQEMETSLLLHLPLKIMIQATLERWLSTPNEHIETIAKFYHSSLLFHDTRERILNLFFPQPPVWDQKKLIIKEQPAPIDAETSKAELLWRLYRGELLGADIQWASYFPDPGYSKHLAQALAQIYLGNLEYYLKKKDVVSVDYALRLFQLAPSKSAIEAIIQNFAQLMARHGETLFQTIEYLPDERLLAKLIDYYQSEEFEAAGLIGFLCDLYQKPLPPKVAQDLASRSNQGSAMGLNKRIRLFCGNCHSSFFYAPTAIYVDERAVDRTGQFSKDSVFVADQFQCKRCANSLITRLQPDQIEEIYQQSRLDHLLRLAPQTPGPRQGYRIVLIDFPRFEGASLAPDAMRGLWQDRLKKGKNPKELAEISLKLAKTDQAMNRWEDSLDVLRKGEPKHFYPIDALLMEGQACLKTGLFPDARQSFDEILTLSGSEQTEQAEQARFFLSFLNDREQKRSRFQILSKKP